MATREDTLKALTGPTDDYALPTSEKETSGGLYGWICPKCGAVMSPFQDYCVKCTNLSTDFIWNTGSSCTLGGSVICHDAPVANYNGGKK